MGFFQGAFKVVTFSFVKGGFARLNLILLLFFTLILIFGAVIDAVKARDPRIVINELGKQTTKADIVLEEGIKSLINGSVKDSFLFRLKLWAYLFYDWFFLWVIYKLILYINESNKAGMFLLAIIIISLIQVLYFRVATGDYRIPFKGAWLFFANIGYIVEPIRNIGNVLPSLNETSQFIENITNSSTPL